MLLRGSEVVRPRAMAAFSISSLRTLNYRRVIWLLIATEVAALVAFFYYALVAQDIYFNMGEFGPHDDVVRYVE
jgi:hypothetical protein